MICPTNSPPKKYFIYEREGIIFTIIAINNNRELLMSIVDLMHQLIFQMSAFIFSESALVLFEGVFTLGVFLSAKTIRKTFSYEQPLHCK